MIERIEKTCGAFEVDLWLCVCERCGWAWVVAHSRGLPAACSSCKNRSWNKGREYAEKLRRGRLSISAVGIGAESASRVQVEGKGNKRQRGIRAARARENGTHANGGTVDGGLSDHCEPAEEERLTPCPGVIVSLDNPDLIGRRCQLKRGHPPPCGPG